MEGILLKKQHRKSLIYAGVLHVVVLFMLIISLSSSHQYALPEATTQPVKIVNATAVNQKAVQNEMAKIKRAQRLKHNRELAHQRYLKKLEANARAARIKEQRHLTYLKNQQKKLEQETKTKEVAAQKKLAEMHKQQKLEQAHLAALKKQHQKNSAKTESKKKEQLSAEKKLQKQIDAEQSQINQARKAHILTQVDKYKALVLNTISQHWIVPENVNKKLSTQLTIRVAPGGTVLSVHVLKTSGNAVLDRSVINAVWKASPLPVPQDPVVFAQFREFHLTVKPEGLL